MAPRKDQFVLNMPDGMRQKIKIMAEKNMRTMTAEILLAVRERMERAENEKADATAS